MAPVPIVIVDKGTGTGRALLSDVCEMLTVVSQTLFARPAPFGWGIGASVRLANSETDIAPGEQVIALERVPNAPDALGDHDAPNGMPMSHVFPSLENSIDDLPVTIGHELFEMLVDAMCCLAAHGSDAVWRALEVGDAVETDTFVFTCASGRKLACTNWVLPAWFSGGAPGQLFDHLGLCKQDGEVRPGGYISTWDAARGWTQETNGEKRDYRKRVAALGVTRADRRAA